MRLLLAGSDRERALRWFEQEEPSLNMALGVFIERQRLYLARKLVSALWPYWVIRGRMRDGSRWLDYLIDRSDDQDPDDVERELLFASGLIGVVDWQQCRGEEATNRGLEPRMPPSTGNLAKGRARRDRHALRAHG